MDATEDQEIKRFYPAVFASWREAWLKGLSRWEEWKKYPGLPDFGVKACEHLQDISHTKRLSPFLCALRGFARSLPFKPVSRQGAKIAKKTIATQAKPLSRRTGTKNHGTTDEHR